jgi:hypothetical protein
MASLRSDAARSRARANCGGRRCGDWYVVVDVARVVDGQPAPRRRALGPISWSLARELAAAWEREHGAGTADVRDWPGNARIVEVGR